MTTDKLISIALFLICFLFSCQEPKIMGNWQRLKFASLPDSTQFPTSAFQEETLSILKDSSLKILRVKESDTSSIPGWHVGNIAGTWRMPNSKTIQFISVEEKSLFPAEWLSKYGSTCMNFQILRLTKNRLILSRQSKLCGNDTLKYKR